MTAEEKRLQESRERQVHWKRWGPYLSERQWGTVREDYSPLGTAWEYVPHEQAPRASEGMALVLDGPTGGAQFASVEGTITHHSSIQGLIDATRRASAIVGLDSGPLHLAAALGKPGVAIFGPTDPARNGPYGGTIAVLRSPGAVTSYKRGPTIDPSMREIDPDQVFETLKSHFVRRSAGCAAE